MQAVWLTGPGGAMSSDVEGLRLVVRVDDYEGCRAGSRAMLGNVAPAGNAPVQSHALAGTAQSWGSLSRRLCLMLDLYGDVRKSPKLR